MEVGPQECSEKGIFLSEGYQWLCQCREPLNESSIEVSEAQEGLYIFDPSRDFPFRNRCDFVLVHSKEFYGGSIKLTFFTLSINPMFAEFGQENTETFGVLFLGLVEDQYVVR